MVGGDDQIAAHHLLRFALQALAHRSPKKPTAVPPPPQSARQQKSSRNRRNAVPAATTRRAYDHGRADQRARNSAGATARAKALQLLATELSQNPGLFGRLDALGHHPKSRLRASSMMVR